VDNLRQSVPALFDGATWTGNGGLSMFDALSRTLGEADYVQVTAPDLEPNPIFAKFMDDMGGQVCAKAIAADGMKSTLTTKTVMRYPDDPDANLRFLRLELHGIYVPDGSMDGLTELRQLYDQILADTTDRTQAWLGVCVAMLTAPEFMAY
jgi:hypothetical protein